MVVLGQIMAFMAIDTVVGPSHKHAPQQRQLTRVHFCHLGKKICRDTFLALHAIGNIITFQKKTTKHSDLST